MEVPPTFRVTPALNKLIETRDAFMEARNVANEANLKVIAAQKEWSMAKDELNQEDKDLINPITSDNQ